MTDEDIERRVAELENAVGERASGGGPDGLRGGGVSRRSFLQGLGIAGLASYAAGTASADPQGQLGTASDPVKTVYAEGVAGGLTGATRVTSLVGDGLSVDSGALTADTSGEANTASNVGAGEGAFKRKSGTDLEFKSLVGGANLSVSAGTDELTLDASATYPGAADDGSTVVAGASEFDFGSNLGVTDDGDGTVTVDATPSGEANTASNVGGATGTFKQKSGSDLEFKSIVGGTNVSLSAGTDTVTIDASDTGEANTASNVGAGSGTFKRKFGSDLEFKSLVGGTNLSITAGADELTLDASATYPSVADGGSEVLSGASDLNFGSNLGVTDDTDGTVTVDATTSGEANTASNVGTGAELFKRKSGTDLGFRTLTTQGTLSATRNTDTVSLGGPWADPDADGLLEPRSGTGYTGIDLSGVSGARVVTPWVGTTGATAFEGYVNGARAASFGTTGSDLNAETAAGNVLLGQYAQAADGAVGAAVGGGGSPTNGHENIVYDDYATIAGGENNRAGSSDTDSTTAAYATVGGGQNNIASASSATVAGGSSGTASGPDSTVGGGSSNTASVKGATVSGGVENTAEGNDQATVGGGYQNTASGFQSTVAGGKNNAANGSEATVAGGKSNTADGFVATIPGGENNSASGNHSFATGRAATAGDDGAVVFGDSTSNAVGSGAANQFVVQAGGGAVVYSTSDTTQSNGVQLAAGGGSWSSLSSAAVKSNFGPVDTERVLDRVVDLDIRRWEYAAEDDGITHMGPIAEQFYDAFGLGPDDDHIVNVDADGVAFAAVQGLADRLDDVRAAVADDGAAAGSDATGDRIADLEAVVSERDDRIDELEAALAEKDDRIDELESRLCDIERALGMGD